MSMILFVIIMMLIIFVPTVRCAFFNPIKTIRYTITDLIQYIKYHQWNNVKSGEIVAYVGLFGKGKTLSMVNRVVNIYNSKNGKKVWCPRRKKFVTQVIKIISNVELSVPYENFISLEQIVLAAKYHTRTDDYNGTLTTTIVVGDEFSVQMNSRNFKNNINALLLNTILTCRHYHISLYYSAQRFQHVDALLRQVTSYVISCDKLWRFQRLNKYDAWDMENATNVQLLKPLARSCWFVTDKAYANYDTMACVGNLTKSFEEGDMMTEAEILALQVGNPQVDAVTNVKRKYRRRR